MVSTRQWLVLPGVVVAALFTAALIRRKGDKMGIPLSNVEYASYVAGAAVAVLIAVVATSLWPAAPQSNQWSPCVRNKLAAVGDPRRVARNA